MDRAIRGASDAPNAEPLILADLAALPPETWPQQRFSLLPSLNMVGLAWSVEPLWRALNRNAEAEADAPEALTHVLLVWRPSLYCQWRSAAENEADALRALAQGATFAQCCEVIAASGAVDPAATAAGFWQHRVMGGLLAKEK